MKLETFFEEVALRRMPEGASRSQGWRVLVGAQLWTRHEMPLWWAWGVLLASICLAIVLGALEQRGGVAKLVSNVISPPVVLVIFGSYFASVYATFTRLGDIIGRVLGYLRDKFVRIVSLCFHFFWDPLWRRLEGPVARCGKVWGEVTHWLFETERGQRTSGLTVLGLIVTLVACFPSFFWGILTDFWQQDGWILKPVLIAIGSLYALLIILVLIRIAIERFLKK